MGNSIEGALVRAVEVTIVAFSLVLGTAAQATGQEGVGSSCPGGDEPQGTVGFTSIECKNCRLSATDGGQVWNFSSEPVVRVVKPGSPADGKVRPGDAIVAIDGHLITTAQGGRTLGSLQPGLAVSMVVRTGSRERTVSMVPVGECPRPGAYAAAPAAAIARAAPVESAPAPEAAGIAVPRAAVAPRPDARPAAGVAVVGPVPRPTFSLLPSGWFGFGIQCTECRWSVEDETGKSAWEFSSPPEISSIQEGSPAEAAGLRRGDVLLEIDGVPLATREGGHRFGTVEPGESVRWTYRRGDETRRTTAIAGRRPGLPEAPPAPAEPGGQPTRAHVPSAAGRLRYSGLIGSTSVEVRGAGSVVVNIVEPGREIEIVTSDSRTRIRLDDSK